MDKQQFGKASGPLLTEGELKGMYDLENKRELKWPVTAEQERRALYILNRRSFRFPFFEAFDPPNTAVSCPVRQTTTVPAQALTLMNNGIVVQQSQAMAARLVHDAGGDWESIVKHAWLLAYNRTPTHAEERMAREFITAAQAAHAPAGVAVAPSPATRESFSSTSCWMVASYSTSPRSRAACQEMAGFKQLLPGSYTQLTRPSKSEV